MKVLLIGPYPPPLGGVSVFIKRYKRQLENEGHQVDVLNFAVRNEAARLASDRYYKLSRALRYAELLLVPFKRYDLIHVSVFSFKLFVMLLLLGLAKKTALMERNWRQLENWNRFQIRFFNAFLSRCHELVFVAPHLEEYYREHGVTLPNRVRVQSPFIPPPLEEETAILQTYPPEVHEFVAQRRPLLIANAYRIVFYKGVDLYGLDMCIDLVAALKQTHPQVGLLFALAEVGELEHYQRIQQRIDQLDIRDNVYFLTGQKELWPMFKKADIMVRPTCTDGYSVSVAEAVHLGCSVVASEVGTRPEGIVLFKNRDLRDFIEKVSGVLWNRHKPQ